MSYLDVHREKGIKRVILLMPQKDKQAAFENKFQLNLTL